MGSLSSAKNPVNHSHAALWLKLWQSVCLHQSEWRGVLMSMDQDKEEWIWREGGGNPGNQNGVRQWASWCAWLTKDRISCVLLFRKYLQKKIGLLVRSSSSPACVEMQRFQESVVSTQSGWVQGHMTGPLQVPGPRDQCLGCVRWASRAPARLNHAFVHL